MTRKKIFVVDDDEMLSEALKDYLEEHTIHEVHLLHTGEECLERLHEMPDIVILDYYLNAIFKDAADGLQILDSIKKMNATTHVIMLSGQESYGVATQAIVKGADTYTMKGDHAFEEICNVIGEIN